MGYRTKALNHHGDECQICGIEADVVHHIDGDRNNNDLDNLAPLCYQCHQKIHAGRALPDEWPHPPGNLAAGSEKERDDTTITLKKEVKGSLEEDKSVHVPWNEYLLWMRKTALLHPGPAEDDTNLIVSEDTKNRLDEHYHGKHYSYDEALNAMMDLLPSLSRMDEGCGCCGESPPSDTPPEEHPGWVHYLYVEQGGHTVKEARWFCSKECVEKAIEDERAYAPREPDLVVIGGRDNFRVRFEGATFHLDGSSMEVGVPVPGAFGGESADGEQYEYEGEPVYVKNEGKWVHQGVIEDILHEEGHTGILLRHGRHVPQKYHPDPDQREQWEEEMEEWVTYECPECESKRYGPEDSEITACPDCGAEVESGLPITSYEVEIE